MDINDALQELHKEKKRLDATIAALERQVKSVGAKPVHKRRGRKTMSREERLAVSKRMAKYWEARRTAARSLEPKMAPGREISDAAASA